MNDNDVVLLGKGHDLFEEPQIHDGRRRIVRKIDDEDLRPRKRLAVDPEEIFEEIAVLTQLDPTNFAACDDETVHMDRVGRGRRQHYVAWPDHGQG